MRKLSSTAGSFNWRLLRKLPVEPDRQRQHPPHSKPFFSEKIPMKNHRIEKVRLGMRAHHRHLPWHLVDGLYIPHAYTSTQDSSGWDDVGFIANRRKVMVWWVHPRTKYLDAIEKQAMLQAGAAPEEPVFGAPIEKCWKRVGHSRKKLLACRTHTFSESFSAYFERVNTIEDQLHAEGIDCAVWPSISVRWYRWGIGMDLCVPIEVRNIKEIGNLAALAKSLLKRSTSISEAFPGYCYGRKEWLGESAKRSDRVLSVTTCQ